MTTKRLILGIVGLAVVLMVTVSIFLFNSEIDRIRAAKERRAAQMGDLPEFSLVDQAGRDVGRDDLVGQITLVNFVFTHSTVHGPALTRQMARLQEDWSEVADIRFVTVTVDPRRDTPAVLAEYAERFGADPERWRFLTGPEDAVYGLIRDGFRAVVRTTGEQEPFEHSLRFVLVDRRGRIRAYLDGLSEDIVAEARPVIRRVLVEN